MVWDFMTILFTGLILDDLPLPKKRKKKKGKKKNWEGDSVILVLTCDCSGCTRYYCDRSKSTVPITNVSRCSWASVSILPTFEEVCAEWRSIAGEESVALGGKGSWYQLNSQVYIIAQIMYLLSCSSLSFTSASLSPPQGQLQLLHRACGVVCIYLSSTQEVLFSECVGYIPLGLKWNLMFCVMKMNGVDWWGIGQWILSI